MTATDEEILNITKGSCTAQAVVEALAILVALRTWHSVWRLQRAVLVIRSDSAAALGALGKLASPAPGVNAVAREIAIDVACSRYGVSFGSTCRASSTTGLIVFLGFVNQVTIAAAQGARADQAFCNQGPLCRLVGSQGRSLAALAWSLTDSGCGYLCLLSSNKIHHSSGAW